MADGGRESGFRVKDAIRMAVRSGRLKTIFDRFHEKMENLGRSCTIDGSRVSFSVGGLTTREDTTAILLGHLVKQLRFDVAPEDMGVALDLSRGLDEIKGELFSNVEFAEQLGTMLEHSEQVDDLHLLARLCLNVMAVCRDNPRLASIGEINDPEIVIEMSKSMVHLLHSRPAAVPKPKAEPSGGTPASPPTLRSVVSPPIIPESGTTEEPPAAEEPPPAVKPSSAERPVKAEERPEAVAQRAEKVASLGLMLTKLGVDDAYKEELLQDEEIKEDPGRGVDTLAQLMADYDIPTVMMALYRNRRVMLGKYANILDGIRDQLAEMSEDKELLEKYSRFVQLLEDKAGLPKKAAYIASRYANQHRMKDRTAVEHILLALKVAPPDHVRRFILENPQKALKTFDLVEFLAKYPLPERIDVDALVTRFVKDGIDLPEVFIRNFIEKYPVLALKPFDELWNHIDYHARILIKRAVQADIPKELARACIDRGVMDFDEIVQEHEGKRTSPLRRLNAWLERGSIEPSKASTALFEALTDIGVDEQYVRESFSGNERYTNPAYKCLSNLKKVIDRYGIHVALILAYQNKEFLLGRTKQKAIDGIRKKIKNVQGDKGPREEYRELVEEIKKMGMSEDVAMWLASHCSTRIVSAAGDIKALRKNISNPYLRRLLLSTPCNLMIAKKVEALLEQYAPDVTEEQTEELVDDVLEKYKGRRQEAYIVNLVRAKARIFAAYPLERTLTAIEHTAREILRRSQVPSEFVEQCLEKGLTTVEEVKAAYDSSSIPDKRGEPRKPRPKRAEEPEAVTPPGTPGEVRADSEAEEPDAVASLWTPGEVIPDSEGSQVLFERLTRFGVSEQFVRQEISENPKYSEVAGACLRRLQDLAREHGHGVALIFVYKMKTCLLGKDPADKVGIVFGLSDTRKLRQMFHKLHDGNQVVADYKERLKEMVKRPDCSLWALEHLPRESYQAFEAIVDELKAMGMPEESALWAVSHVKKGMPRALGDLQLVSRRIPHEVLKGILLKSPNLLANPTRMRELLAQYPVEVTEEQVEQLIAAVLKIAYGRRSEAYLRNVIKANIGALDINSPERVWTFAERRARFLLAETKRRGAIPESQAMMFVDMCLDKGLTTVEEIEAAFESGTIPDKTTQAAGTPGLLSAGERISASEASQVLFERLTQFGFDEEYAKSISENERYNQRAEACLAALQDLVREHGPGVALVIVYKSREALLGKTDTPMQKEVLARIDEAEKSDRLRKYDRLKSELEGLGMPEQAARWVVAYMGNKKPKGLLRDLLALKEHVPHDRLRGILIVSPSRLANASQVRGLLGQFYTPDMSEAAVRQRIKDVMETADGVLPEAFIRKIIESDPILGAYPPKRIWRYVYYRARNIRIRTMETIPEEFVDQCFEAGLTTVEEVEKAYANRSPPSAPPHSTGPEESVPAEDSSPQAQPESARQAEPQEAEEPIDSEEDVLSEEPDIESSGQAEPQEAEEPIDSEEDVLSEEPDIESSGQAEPQEAEEPAESLEEVPAGSSDTTAVEAVRDIAKTQYEVWELLTTYGLPEETAEQIIAMAHTENILDDVLNRIKLAQRILDSYISSQSKRDQYLKRYISENPRKLYRISHDEFANDVNTYGKSAANHEEVLSQRGERKRVKKKNGTNQLPIANGNEATLEIMRSIPVPPEIQVYFECRGVDFYEVALCVLRTFDWYSKGVPRDLQKEDYEKALQRYAGQKMQKTVASLLRSLIKEKTGGRKVELKSENDLDENTRSMEFLRYLKRASHTIQHNGA